MVVITDLCGSVKCSNATKQDEEATRFILEIIE